MLIDYESYGIIVLESSREMVESGDSSNIMLVLDDVLSDRSHVLKCRNRISLMFSGYDDDPRELYHIPEVRAYVKKLDERFPFWFYFINKESGMLKVIALCLCEIVQRSGWSSPVPEDFREFLLSHFDDLNCLCDYFDLGEDVIRSVSDEVLHAYDLYEE